MTHICLSYVCVLRSFLILFDLRQSGSGRASVKVEARRLPRAMASAARTDRDSSRRRIMFCFQCEQTSKGTGCTDFAVCGKDEETAVLQDLLLHATKGVAQYAQRARRLGARDAAVDRFLLRGLFLTVTNVNFDAAAIERAIRDAAAMRDRAKALYEQAAARKGVKAEAVRGPATWAPAPHRQGLVSTGSVVSVLGRRDAFGADISGLQELLT